MVERPIIAAPTLPQSVSANTPITISSFVSSEKALRDCKLYVGNDEVDHLSLTDAGASGSYTFPSAGVYTVSMFCVTVNGGMAGSPNVSILVEAGSGSGSGSGTVDPAPVTELPSEGNLLKAPCAKDAKPDDPCTAVYYYGLDGERHAFPNDLVFFTWFDNFDKVITVESPLLEKIPLGKNVTYKPGSRLVKFPSMDAVFFVSSPNVLRWVTSEEVAVSLYGAEWNKQVEDISDAFFSDYSVGEDVKEPGQVSIKQEQELTPTIDQLFSK
jgi:hypothetical protein